MRKDCSLPGNQRVAEFRATGHGDVHSMPNTISSSTASAQQAMRNLAQSVRTYDFDAAPWMVIWEMTRACALACRHCRAAAMRSPDPAQLTTAEGHRLIDEIAGLDPKLLILTGGDPAMRVDLIELIQHAAKDRGLRVALSPSATPRLAKMDFLKLREAGVARMSMSLDGANPAAHDAFRGIHGTWAMTDRILERARDADLPIQINTTFTKSNIADFDGFRRLMEQINPVLWSVFLVVPTGRAQMEELPTADEVETLFIRLHEHSKTASYDIKTTAGHHYRRVTLQRSGTLENAARRAPHGINDGRGVVFVSHRGEIQPSGFVPITAGSVRTRRLGEIYKSHPVFKQLRDRDLLRGKCGQCEFKFICGGSRARAHAVTGNYLEADPLCSYQPAAARITPGPRLPISVPSS